jgi:thymidylate synthase (FAD)
VESQRAVDMSDFLSHTPEDIANDVCRFAVFHHAVEAARRGYKQLVDMGINREDAAYLLPEACYTTEVLTMNGRAIRHFYTLRADGAAQAEIQEMANRIRELVEPICPVIFHGFV